MRQRLPSTGDEVEGVDSWNRWTSRQSVGLPVLIITTRPQPTKRDSRVTETVGLPAMTSRHITVGTENRRVGVGAGDGVGLGRVGMGFGLELGVGIGLGVGMGICTGATSGFRGGGGGRRGRAPPF